MIVIWTVTFYSKRVEDEIFALPAGMLARFLRYAERMEAYGPDLGMPHTRSMGGGIFELRIKAAEGIARSEKTGTFCISVGARTWTRAFGPSVSLEIVTT